MIAWGSSSPIRRCTFSVTLGVFWLSAMPSALLAQDAEKATQKDAAAGKLAVFILAGQSNMQGLGKGAELPAELQKPREDVLMFDGARWQPLKPGGRFGPEVTFGRAMADALKRPAGIVKLGVGSTNLAYNWHPDVKDNLYAQLRKTVDAAGKARPIEIAGMLWMQGERDSLYPGTSQKYAANLDTLINAARRDYGAAQMPFVLGRVNPPPAKYPFVEGVRKAQASVSMPATAWVNCDDLAKLPDNLHYNTHGQIELGKRFAEAMTKLLAPAGPDGKKAD